MFRHSNGCSHYHSDENLPEQVLLFFLVPLPFILLAFAGLRLWVRGH